jgi:hypothetical protein
VPAKNERRILGVIAAARATPKGRTENSRWPKSRNEIQLSSTMTIRSCLPARRKAPCGFAECRAFNEGAHYGTLCARYGPFREFVTVVRNAHGAVIGGLNPSPSRWRTRHSATSDDP